MVYITSQDISTPSVLPFNTALKWQWSKNKKSGGAEIETRPTKICFSDPSIQSPRNGTFLTFTHCLQITIPKEITVYHVLKSHILYTYRLGWVLNADAY